MIPPEYVGREQSYLKHQFLREYLRRWGHKLASMGRNRPVKLWYVDCFAGPWQSHNQNLDDTSIHIGLTALREASQTWRDKAAHVEIGAVFVEKSPSAHARLTQYLKTNSEGVDCRHYLGEFGNHVQIIRNIIGRDPAFIFVDPTGFKGVAMRFIQPLVAEGNRDVLINVMFNDINRFKDDPREFLRAQIGDFFGLQPGQLAPGLDEEQLMAVYRANLKVRTGLTWAADAAVPHPTHARTKFRLVIGGGASAVLDVFREAEAKVLRDLAASVRVGARQAQLLEQKGQTSLFAPDEVALQSDSGFEAHESTAKTRTIPMIRELVQDGPLAWGQIWPQVLELLHVAKPALAERVTGAHEAGDLHITPDPGSRRRSLADADMIGLGNRGSPAIDPDRIP